MHACSGFIFELSHTDGQWMEALKLQTINIDNIYIYITQNVQYLTIMEVIFTEQFNLDMN